MGQIPYSRVVLQLCMKLDGKKDLKKDHWKWAVKISVWPRDSVLDHEGPWPLPQDLSLLEPLRVCRLGAQYSQKHP